MLSIFDFLSVLLVVTAVFAWVNYRFIKLPTNIGLLVMGLAASLLLIAVELLFPNVSFFGTVHEAILTIDFHETVMNVMLAFLLFAGALHVDLTRLRNRAWVVGVLATVGVGISTVIVATGMWGAAQLLGYDLPYTWALVFGSLIAPTDPVAVLSTLKRSKVSKELETDMTGESLFNDGVGVVLFGLFLSIAVGGGGGGEHGAEAAHGAADIGGAFQMLAVEAGGGALLGLVAGFLAYGAMRTMDDYSIEVLISLAMVMGGYALAHQLHVSGPIAVVVAGVIIGNTGAMHAMSEVTKRYVFSFWTLIDEMLNALLFLLIGIEVIVLAFDPSLAIIGLVAIPLVLIARLVSVSAPIAALRPFHVFPKGTILLLTWGGLRGGISVALALSLPPSEYRPLILAATYAVVLFTIIVQGLSLGSVARKIAAESPADPAAEAEAGH